MTTEPTAPGEHAFSAGTPRAPGAEPPPVTATAAPAAAPPMAVLGEAVILSSPQAEAIVRVVESAPSVRRRYQFFVWTQSHLQALVPHTVAVCGAYQRQRREMEFETLHSVVLSPAALATLTDGSGALMRAVSGAWIEGRGRPLALDPTRFMGEARDAGLRLHDECRIDALLVHGVSRPQRPAELETLFMFASAARTGIAQHLMHLDLLLPHLHCAWLRVQSTERELQGPMATAASPSRPPERTRKPITPRERQILAWVRDGKSNQQVGEELGISPLTVKNHIQKILRKLGASNRAQAVAMAISLNLMGCEGD